MDGELWPPPQPERIPAPAHASNSRTAKRTARSCFLLRKRGSRIEIKPKPAIEDLATNAEVELPLVETETVKLLVLPLARFNDAGLIVHVAPVGTPVQVKAIIPLIPGTPVTDRL